MYFSDIHVRGHGVSSEGPSWLSVFLEHCTKGNIYLLRLSVTLFSCYFADINECMDDPGICQHNCTNTVGSYECTCPPGYRVSKDKSACEGMYISHMVIVLSSLWR